MANVIRLKRRVSGIAGAPSALKSAELAHNEVDDTLYVGKGDDGSGNATSVIPLAGKGAFVDLATAQTVAGAKTFSTVPKVLQDASGSTDLVRKSQLDTLLTAKAPLASPGFSGTPTAPTAAPATNTTQLATTAFVQDALAGVGAGDMMKSVYDTTTNGKVDVAETADAVAWSGVTGKPSSFTPATHNHPTSEVTGLEAALAAKAPLASPALTGTPTAPTATAGNSSAQLATTAFVAAAVAAVVNGSPGALDTLNELAAALGNDANFSATITNSLAGKLVKTSNLSDLNDVAAARTNLGIGSIANQNASSVAITGGSIDGIVLDGGTF